MKIRITFKTPDALEYAIPGDVSDSLREKAYDIASKWINYGETITVEIDLDTKKIKVLEAIKMPS